jgi:hypothetical protein
MMTSEATMLMRTPDDRRFPWQVLTVLAMLGAVPAFAGVATTAATALGAAPPENSEADAVVVQFLGGMALNLPTTLSFHHDDLGRFDHAARWETRPLDQPFYWAARVRWQRAVDGFELQLLHHKLYLRNNPPGVDHFEVTHGFNLLTVNYLRRTRPVQLRGGLGVVIPDTESIVQGQHRDDGYSVAGPALLVGAGWEHALGRYVLLAAEAQFAAGWATVGIDGGDARVRSLALHLLVGVGIRL